MATSVLDGHLAAHPQADPALAAVAAAALPLTGADVSGVLLAEEDGDAVQVAACAGRWTVHSANLRVRRGHGLAGRILETGRPWKVDDYTCDRTVDAEEFLPVLVEEGMLAGLGAPMRAGDALVGVLMVWSARRSAFDTAATQALVHLADVAAVAVAGTALARRREGELAALVRRHRELADRADVLAAGVEVRDELTGLLLAAADLPELLAAACTRTGGDAALFDPALGELATCGAAGPLRERLARYLRRAGPDGDGAVLPPGPRFPRWTLLRPVVADDVTLGRLALCLPRSPAPADHETAAQAALACALHLTRERAVLVARSGVHADFVWQLLEGLVDEPVASVRARRLGCALPVRLRVVLVPLGAAGDGPGAAGSGGDPDPERHRLDALVAAAERLARAAGAAVLAGARGGTLALILDAGAEDPPARAVVEAVVRGLRRHAPGAVAAAGVSACVDWSADLRAAYRQARHALAAGEGDAEVTLFDELGLMRFLLAPSDRADQDRFARSVLGPVLDYDREHHTDLVATLGTYLDEGCSLTRTAAARYVHPKTVRYRLRRVEELARRDLSDQRERFDAQLAIAILRALALDPDQEPPPGAGAGSPGAATFS